MEKELNKFEVVTLFEAYERISKKNENRIFIPAPFEDCKKNLPTLINKGLIHKDTLKYTGFAVLTEKGIVAGRKLYEAVEQM